MENGPMLDTMTFTKILGGFCGALLIFMLGKWVAEEMYAMGGGHGKEDHGPAYVILTDDGGEETAEVEEGPSFAELYASADIAAGEKVFGKCKACHAVDGTDKTGPHLDGVVGRDVDAVAGFNYSGALSAVVATWTPEELDAFIENPKGYAPGTSMGFSGLKKIQDRVDVIAYLDNTDGSMTELVVPAAAEPASEPAAEEATQEDAAAEPATEETTEETAVEAAPEETTEEVAAAEQASEAETTPEAATSDVAGFAALVAAADLDAGAKAFKKCAACHVADKEQNRVGPHLVGIVGRDVASVDGFSYSDALNGIEGDWDLDKLSAWLESPRGFAPGNRMSFRGVSDEQDRANLIGYLQSIGQ